MTPNRLPRWGLVEGQAGVFSVPATEELAKNCLSCCDTLFTILCFCVVFTAVVDVVVAAAFVAGGVVGRGDGGARFVLSLPPLLSSLAVPLYPVCIKT